MKYLFLFFLVILTSCGTKDGLNDFFSGNSLKSKSSVDPLAKAKTIAQKHGDGKYITKTIKIPLTEDTISSYDLSAILEDETLDQKDLGFFGRMKKNIKRFIYKAAVKLRVKNHVKYSTELSLEGMPLSILSSLKVKRVFFTLEDCPVDDKKCITQDEKRPVTFDFLEGFFLNASILKDEDDKQFMLEEDALDHEGHLILDEFGKPKTTRPYAFKELKKREFKKLSEQAYKFESQTDENKIKQFDLASEDDSQFYDITLARKEKVDKEQENDLPNEYKGNTTIIIKSDTKGQDSIIKIKRLLKKANLKTIVKDISLVGENLFVELKEDKTQKDLLEKLNLDEDSKKENGISSIGKCSNDKCIELEIDKRDLAPMLRESQLLRLDTYIALKKLEFNDFRYNGYVELELKLDLPL